MPRKRVPMLLDEILGCGPLMTADGRAFIDLLATASRYVIAPSVVEAGIGLAASFSEGCGVRAVQPSAVTWLEWRDEHSSFGVALMVQGDSGRGLLYESVDGARMPHGGIFFYDPSMLRVEPEWFGCKDFAGSASLTPDGIGRLTFAFLALINTPRVVDVEERGSREQAKQRRAQNLQPEHVHRVVTIRPDAREAAGNTAAGRHNPDDEVGVARHKVRAHLRVLPSCSVTVVRQHWRGDAAFGTTEQVHVVRTAADREWRAPA